MAVTATAGNENVKPVVLALSASGEVVARKVADLLGADLHGREGRVAEADAFFPNALDHARDLFTAGVPVVGVSASGIKIRALIHKLRCPPTG
jgi:cobalt-precorrin 5A hydrolase/precorrin-3B C17-methyltransferase